MTDGLQLLDFFREFFAIPRRADVSSRDARFLSRTPSPCSASASRPCLSSLSLLPRPAGLHRCLPIGRLPVRDPWPRYFIEPTFHPADHFARDYPATIIFTPSRPLPAWRIRRPAIPSRPRLIARVSRRVASPRVANNCRSRSLGKSFEFSEYTEEKTRIRPGLSVISG